MSPKSVRSTSFTFSSTFILFLEEPKIRKYSLRSPTHAGCFVDQFRLYRKFKWIEFVFWILYLGTTRTGKITKSGSLINISYLMLCIMSKFVKRQNVDIRKIIIEPEKQYKKYNSQNFRLFVAVSPFVMTVKLKLC